ncbi:SpcZ, partial [Streptomyces lasiicapitis]
SAAVSAPLTENPNPHPPARSPAPPPPRAPAGGGAAAIAAGDEQAFAETYPFAYAHACALAHAQRDEGRALEKDTQDAQEARDGADIRAEQYRSACGRLGQGLAESVGRAAG